MILLLLIGLGTMMVQAQTYPINFLPYTITLPGNYVLSANLTGNAGTLISIVASNVTLDLNGHTIQSTQSTYGIALHSVQNVVVKNGSIRNPITLTSPEQGGGIYLDRCTQCLITGLSISSKQEGILDYGGFEDVFKDCRLIVEPSLKPAITLNNTGGDVVEDCVIYAQATGVLTEMHSVHTTNVIRHNIIYAIGSPGLSLQADSNIDNTVIDNL